MRKRHEIAGVCLASSSAEVQIANRDSAFPRCETLLLGPWLQPESERLVLVRVQKILLGRIFCEVSFLTMNHNGQSRLGIASLSLAVFNILITFIIFLIAGVWEASAPGGVDEDSAAAIILGLSLFACIGINLVSMGLGIAGIVQKQRERICAFIGTSLATASFVITVALLAVGMMLDA